MEKRQLNVTNCSACTFNHPRLTFYRTHPTDTWAAECPTVRRPIYAEDKD